MRLEIGTITKHESNTTQNYSLTCEDVSQT